MENRGTAKNVQETHPDKKVWRKPWRKAKRGKPSHFIPHSHNPIKSTYDQTGLPSCNEDESWREYRMYLFSQLPSLSSAARAAFSTGAAVVSVPAAEILDPTKLESSSSTSLYPRHSAFSLKRSETRLKTLEEEAVSAALAAAAATAAAAAERARIAAQAALAMQAEQEMEAAKAIEDARIARELAAEKEKGPGIAATLLSKRRRIPKNRQRTSQTGATELSLSLQNGKRDQVSPIHSRPPPPMVSPRFAARLVELVSTTAPVSMSQYQGGKQPSSQATKRSSVSRPKGIHRQSPPPSSSVQPNRSQTTPPMTTRSHRLAQGHQPSSTSTPAPAPVHVHHQAPQAPPLNVPPHSFAPSRSSHPAVPPSHHPPQTANSAAQSTPNINHQQPVNHPPPATIHQPPPSLQFPPANQPPSAHSPNPYQASFAQQPPSAQQSQPSYQQLPRHLQSPSSQLPQLNQSRQSSVPVSSPPPAPQPNPPSKTPVSSYAPPPPKTPEPPYSSSPSQNPTTQPYQAQPSSQYFYGMSTNQERQTYQQPIPNQPQPSNAPQSQNQAQSPNHPQPSLSPHPPSSSQPYSSRALYGTLPKKSPSANPATSEYQQGVTGVMAATQPTTMPHVTIAMLPNTAAAANQNQWTQQKPPEPSTELRNPTQRPSSASRPSVGALLRSGFRSLARSSVSAAALDRPKPADTGTSVAWNTAKIAAPADDPPTSFTNPDRILPPSDLSENDSAIWVRPPSQSTIPWSTAWQNPVALPVFTETRNVDTVLENKQELNATAWQEQYNFPLDISTGQVSQTIYEINQPGSLSSLPQPYVTPESMAPHRTDWWQKCSEQKPSGMHWSTSVSSPPARSTIPQQQLHTATLAPPQRNNLTSNWLPSARSASSMWQNQLSEEKDKKDIGLESVYQQAFFQAYDNGPYQQQQQQQHYPETVLEEASNEDPQ